MFQQRVVNRQFVFDFFRTSHQLYILAEQTSCNHHVLFHFFSSLQSLHQLSDEERSQIVLLALLFYFENHCFFSLYLLQLCALIDVVVQRNDDRRCVNFALNIRLRDRDVRCQDDDDLCRISLNIVQFVVYLFQRYRHLFLHHQCRQQDAHTLKKRQRHERIYFVNRFVTQKVIDFFDNMLFAIFY